MSRPLLLLTQKNELFKLLRSFDLPLNDFVWETPEGHFGVSIPRLTHSPSGLYFEILFSEGFLKSVTYFPGPSGSKWHGQVRDWNGVMRDAEVWARFLKREVSVPDLWASIQSEREFMSGGSIAIANSAFDKNELKRITESLQEIREFLEKNHNLSQDQFAFVSSKFSLLEEAATRVGRKDWNMIAIGALVSIAIAIALSTDQFREFLHFAVNSLSWVATVVRALPS
jgi:hypothetical protein